VGVLVIAFVFSIADRIIIGLLVDPIKADLGISESQISLLMGIWFAIFYAAVGLPMGRLADRHSRRTIIAAGIFLWSLMTAVCGLTRNFWELFLARVGVGVGEATLSPAAYSMIADYFPREKLGRALAVYQSGAFFGVGLALIFGAIAIGWAKGADQFVMPVIGAIKPWQLAFIAIGLPGVLVAALMLTVREPLRQGIDASHDDEISLKQAFRFAFRRWRVYIAHFCAFALLAVPMATLAVWMPTYFIRVLGYTPVETGLKLGLAIVVFAPIGVIGGGWFADYLLRKGYQDATLRIGILAAVIMIPLSLVATSVKDPTLALMIACPFAFGSSISMGMAAASLQLVTPNRLRGQISAAWMLFLNIISALLVSAIGPITQFVYNDMTAVGQSITVVNVGSVVVGGLILWATLKPYRQAVLQQGIE
jgi:MFS family permease